jgi:hypothetical protein
MSKPGKSAHSRWGKLSVVVVVVLFVVLASAVALERYWAFSQPLGLDNAYFFQRVWQAAFMDESARTLLNTELGQGLIAGRHFEPALILALPWVRFVPRMESLLVFQVCLVGLGGIAAYALARLATRDAFTAIMLMGAWICQPGLWQMATRDFRTMALAVPFIVFFWWAWMARRWRWALLGGVAAMACREEVMWLLLAGLPVVLLLQDKDKRLRAGAVFLGLVVCWWSVLHTLHGAPSDFIAVSEVPGAAWDALGQFSWQDAADQRTSGGALSQLQSATGGGIWFIPLAPLAALPVFLTWLGKAMNPEVAGPWAYHLWAVALGTMALVVPLAVSRIGRWVQAVRGGDWGLRSMRAVAAALFILHAQFIHEQFGPDLSQTRKILSGERSPHLRLGTPWEAIRRVPEGVPVLTEALYVAQLADRPVIYAADDFRKPPAQAQVLSSVEWVLLRKKHEWQPLLETSGFVPRAEGGNVRLYHRTGAPGAHFNPILPE